MNPILARTFGPHAAVLLAAALVSVAACNAWDYQYGYNSVVASNADIHVVSASSIEKYATPAWAYYQTSLVRTGLSLLTYRFDFDEPVNRAHLIANFNVSTYSYYAGLSGWISPGGTGYLRASTDGRTWSSLFTAYPPPGLPPGQEGTTAANRSFNDLLPAQLLGSTSVWVQVELGYNWPGRAIFSFVSGGGPGTNIFQFSADVKPRLVGRRIGPTFLQLAWSTNYPGYVLETASSLTGVNWIPIITNGAAVSGSDYVTLSIVADARRFYRLRKN